MEKLKQSILKMLNDDRGRFASARDVEQYFSDSLDRIEQKAIEETIRSISHGEEWEESEEHYKELLLKRRR